ncbi:MAG: hypothetical protein Q8Q13_03615, partial [bacterium]|nr:hypothetical protein [bacterium]
MRRGRAVNFNNRAAGTVLCLLVTSGLFSLPFVASAQEFMLTFEPTFRAEHAGISIYNGNPVDIHMFPEIATIRSSQLSAVNGAWIIEELRAWGHDVPSERAVYVIARIDPDSGKIEGGTAILGQNYDVAHFAFNESATTTHSGSFSIPILGESETTSGRYKIFAAELPETKDVYDPETDTHTISAYTDEDAGEFLERGPMNAGPYAPVSYSTLPAIFDYVNDGLPPCTENCFSNVLFLPGIESSRLYWIDVLGGGEKKLWEPGVNDDLHDLYLNSQGESIRDNVYAKKSGVIDELPGGKNVYKSLIAKMDDLKVKKDINDWEAVPYDWRLSLDDTLGSGRYFSSGQIYYSGTFAATTTPYIIQELRHLARSSKTGKVTVIAHSNGGLVAKRLTAILGAEASQLIDKMIFVAVPQAGTPMAIAAGLHGYEQQHLGGLINSEAEARTFSSTTPMLYNLLPSAQYFTYVDDPVVQFDSSLPDWIAKYGAAI